MSDCVAHRLNFSRHLRCLKNLCPIQLAATTGIFLPAFRILAIIMFLLVSAGRLLHGQSAGPVIGTPANGTYAGSPDQLNLGNLNLHMSIPLFTKPGRGLSYEYDLSYDSSVWINKSGTWTPRSPTQWGWQASTPQTIGSTSQVAIGSTVCKQITQYEADYYYTASGFTYTTADGVTNTFSGQATYNQCTGASTSISSQSTYGYKLYATVHSSASASGTITDPSGNTLGVIFQNGLASRGSTNVITDRNGNSVGKAITQGYYGYYDTAGTNPLTVTADIMTGYENTVDTQLPASLYYTDPNGNKQTIAVQSQQFTVQTNFGVSGVAEYSNTGITLPTRILLPDGSSYSFTYEPTPGYPSSVTGRLASITLPTGGTISYTYTGSNNGIESDGSVAGVTRTTSDGSIQYSRSNVIPVSGTGIGSSTTTTTDPYGNQTVISFQGIYEVGRSVYTGAAGGTPLRSASTCYNSNASSCNSQKLILPFTEIYKSTTLDNGLTSATDTHFNSSGLVTQISEYDFGASSPTRTTSISYASLGNNIQDKPQTVTQTDGSGNRLSSTTYGYDDSSCALVATSGLPEHVAVSGSRGNLTTTTAWVNSTTSLVTHTCSDDAGQVRSSTDASNNVTQYSYDAATDTFLTGVNYPTPTSGVALSTSASYDPNTGAVLSLTDVNTQKTTIAYDGSIRPLTITSPAISAGTPTTSFTYPSPTQTNVSKPMGNGTTATVEVLVDAYGRTSRSATYNGQSSNPYYQQDTCYDKSGRVSFISEPYQGIGFGTAAQCSNTGDLTQYDALGRPLKITHADGTSFSYFYGGRAAEMVDEGNGTTSPSTRVLQSDGLGRLMSVCEITSTTLPNSGVPGACGLDISSLTGYSTSYAYNLAQHMTTVTQGAQTRTFQTDGLGRAILATEPERGTTTYSYTYNTTGLQSVRTRPRANQTNASVTTATTTQNDSLGRAISISYDDGLTPAKNFYYDALPTGLGWAQSLGFTKGQLVATSSGSGTTATGTLLNYDSNGNVIALWSCAPSICGTSSQSSRSETFSYDLAGSLTQVSDPTSGAISYGRSVAGEITSVTNGTFTDLTNTPNLVSNVVNSPFGPTSYALGNGLTSVQAYDSLGRNNGKWVCLGSSSPSCSGGSKQLYGVTATYIGSVVTSSCDTVLNQCQSHGYDQFNRITSVTDQSSNSNNPGSFSYTYDRYGNRVSQTAESGGPSISCFPNPANNQNTTSNTTYDAAGNLRNDGTCLNNGVAHGYTYDAEGNVTAVDGGSTAQYVYDALNHRVRAQTASLTNEYLFDSSGERVSTWSVAQNLGTEGRIYMDGQQLAFRNGSTYFEHQNWLGTERMRTDYQGHVATTERSLAYGDGFLQSVTDSGSDVDNNQFAGQDYDSESSTQHAQFRQYSSMEGRWMSADPYDGSYDPGNPQSMNRYAYGLNNPHSLIDPSGLDLAFVSVKDDSGCGGCLPTATSQNPLAYLLYLLSQLGSHLNVDPGISNGGGGFSFSGEGPTAARLPIAMGYQNMARPAQQQTGRQPNGSYVAPTGPGTPIGNITDPAKPVPPMIGNGQCVAACSRLSGVTADTSQWTPGAAVSGNSSIPIGTAIATFGPDNKFHSDGTMNSGIYMGQNKNGGIEILDQWTAHPQSGTPEHHPALRPLVYDRHEDGLSNSARYYHVIIVP